MDSNHDIASLPPLRAEFAGGTFRGITTRKDGTHCAVILLPNEATEQRNWQACVDWAREAGGELPTRSVFHLLRLSATKEELAEVGWYYTADLLSDDTGDEDDAAYAWSCHLTSGSTFSTLKSYEGLAVAVRLIPLTSTAKVGGDDMEQAWLKWINDARFYDWHNTNECAQLHFAAGFNAARAALSADGGDAIGQKKAAFLKHEGAVETGVMLRAENGIALVTYQGRVEWYDANEFGGIQLSAEGGDKRAYPDELTDDMREVLGWLCYQCAPYAHAFRKAGASIKTRAEDEQAFVLHWLVKLVLDHPDDWRKVGAEQAKVAIDAANQAKGDA